MLLPGKRCRLQYIHDLLALAAQMDLRFYQMNAVTVFLQGDLTKEEIYMEQPDGFLVEKNA